MNKLNTEEMNRFRFSSQTFEEIEKDGKTGLGEIKHWHIFEIIAKKK